MLLNQLIREFMAVCSFLIKKGYGDRKGFYVIDKGQLEKLLNQNRYLPAEKKLKIWKRLNWIDTDPDHLTKRVYEEKKYVRKVKIHVCVYKEIQEILQGNVT